MTMLHQTTIRLDRALVERGYVTSRTRAQALITSEGVAVNGKVANELDFRVGTRDKITIVGEELKWVSRAGLKLEHALKHWKINPKGKIVLDVGASTGGFTEVLLAHNAKKVYALDVGHSQLAEKLKADRRVVNMERTHIKDVTAESIREKPDMIVIDVSFISLEKVLPRVAELLKKNGILVLLIKPQFEVGKEHVKKGIVTDTRLHAAVARKIEECAIGLGFDVQGVIASPVTGGDGNREFLLYGIKLAV